jgi:NAD(P)-dependent dehydrogenase (short-subunit alcohol dehydrogenase family)
MTEQRVFITGGAGGLGKAVALRFARAGAKVCIGDVKDELGHETLKELKAIAPDALYVTCDVRQLSALEAARDLMVEHWGGVDVLVNNAGVGGAAGTIDRVEEADWQWVLDINVMGPVRGCKAFVPVLKQQRGGHIVNIASAAGLMNPPRMANYNASKAAVVSLSETLRLELAEHGIGVSVVCPGFFPTDLASTVRSTKEGTQQWVEKAMQRSEVSADDVANLIFAAVDKKLFWVLPHKLERRLWRLKRWFPEYYYKKILARVKKFFPA